MESKAIKITDKINLQIMLSPHVGKSTQILNGIAYLEDRKHNFLTMKYSYKIKNGYITVFNVPIQEAETITSIINF